MSDFYDENKNNMKKYAKLIKVLTIVLCSVVGAIVLFAVLWPLPYYWFVVMPIKIGRLATSPEFWLNATIFVAIVAAIVIFSIFILPFAIFFFKKIYTYLSLLFICIFKGHKFKLKRTLFASAKGMTSKGDILIETKDGNICLHFLDVVKPTKRAVTIPNDSEYVLTPVYGKNTKKFVMIRGEVAKYGQSGNEGVGNKFGVYMSSGHIKANDRDKVKKLPEINDNYKHVFVVSSMPVELNILQNGELLALGDGQSIGKLTFYTMKHLKNGLKKRLHNSIFE